MCRLALGAFVLLLTLASGRAATFTPTQSVVYKRIGDVELKLDIFTPTGAIPGRTYPGIVLFFGGGWTNGSPSQLYPQCARLAADGMVAMSAEYRIASKHHTTPRECVMDGKSCLRWIQAHAAALQIDPQRLAAGGASAGGQVAMGAVVLPGFNEAKEEPVAIRVAALVLFNPVIDNGPDGYGYDRVKDYYQELSPLHNLHPGIPPTLAQWGTRDQYVPIATAERFGAEMKAQGNRCEVILYDGQPHGFFNYKEPANPYFEQTMAATERFLSSVGLIAAPAGAPAAN